MISSNKLEAYWERFSVWYQSYVFTSSLLVSILSGLFLEVVLFRLMGAEGGRFWPVFIFGMINIIFLNIMTGKTVGKIREEMMNDPEVARFAAELEELLKKGEEALKKRQAKKED